MKFNIKNSAFNLATLKTVSLQKSNMESQPVMGHYQCNSKTVKDTKVKCATFKSAILKTENCNT